MSNASFQMNGVEVFAENAQTVTVKNINVDANDTTTPSMCKAWVNFNGTLDENSGSLTVGENVLIRASYNVSSVYYNGTGDYTINFATAMPDTNYCASAWAGGGSAGAAACSVVQDGFVSTTSLRLQSRDLNTSAAHNTNNMYESSIVMISVFR